MAILVSMAKPVFYIRISESVTERPENASSGVLKGIKNHLVTIIKTYPPF